MNEVRIQSAEERLLEIDAKIAEVSQAACRLLDEGATLGRIEDEVAFLHTLYRRRGTILNEYMKAGGAVADRYAPSWRAI